MPASQIKTSSSKERKRNWLGKTTTYTLNANEREHKGYTDRLRINREKTVGRLYKEQGKNDGLHDGR